MAVSAATAKDRRRFLRLLAASPVLPYLDLPRAWRAAIAPETGLIASPGDAINVFAFEAVARKNLPPAHFGYMATGSDDDAMIRANREGFSRYQLRVRRLIEVSKIDMSVQMLGVKWDTPIVTREDAEIAMQPGVNGLLVSNHGGLAEESRRPTIECVPEVVAGVAGTTSVAHITRAQVVDHLAR